MDEVGQGLEITSHITSPFGCHPSSRSGIRDSAVMVSGVCLVSEILRLCKGPSTGPTPAHLFMQKREVETPNADRHGLRLSNNQTHKLL
eukprot:1327684-Amphidinium_carterae.1